MKRFLLFVGDQYYPTGGGADLFGDFDSAEDARAALDQFPLDHDYADWANLLDTQRNVDDALVERLYRNRGEWISWEAT